MKNSSRCVLNIIFILIYFTALLLGIFLFIPHWIATGNNLFKLITIEFEKLFEILEKYIDNF
jgi:hypothetical protein